MILPLVLFLLGANGSGSNQGVCVSPWRKGEASCYLINTTAVTRDIAWQSCLNADSQSSLVVLETESENNIVGVMSEGDGLSDYWTSGTRDGWEVYEDGVGTFFIDYTFENWFGGSRDNAGWSSTGKNGMFVTTEGTNTREWKMSHTSDEYVYGFVCEIPLDTCYTGLSVARTVWSRTFVETEANTTCPTGYSGIQTRYCDSSAVFQTPFTQNCTAVVDENGWTDDTAADGFAWQDITLNDGSSHGPFRSGSSNQKMFDVSSTDTTAYPYLYISFTATPANSWDGDVTVFVNGLEVDSYQFSDTLAFSTVVPRESFHAQETFTMEIVANMDGEDSSSVKEFTITDLYIEAYNRQDMSEACYRKHSFNESTANPVFEQANSGFLSTADDLTIEFTIPRELYDVQIEFVGQEDATVGYTDAIAATSLWESDRTTSSKCGAETWTADIPWTSLTGVFTSVESFNDGTQTVDNAGETYYVFTAVMNITATEKLVSYNPIAARDWEQPRTAMWRYPFALKWLRDVDVQTQLDVFVCADGATICTVRHVAAIVSFVQTEVDPIAGLSGGEYGKVVLGIRTKVAYPYMFVSGAASDDPPNDQVSGSSLTDYEAMYGSWDPPIVVASPAIVEGVQQVVTSSMSFQWEDTASCSHDPAAAVETQTTKECEQTWNLILTPTSGSCYVTGDYTLQFSARCMYDKPVCVFLTDSNTGLYQNGVSTTMSVQSTQMCPSLVEDVDLSGSLCSTGRAQDNMGYLTGCDPDATYVQGEVTHFITEVSSSIAAIEKTEIIQIFATQDYSTWNTQEASDAGLLPRFDNSWDGKNTLWVEGDTVPTVSSFSPGDGGVAVGNDLLITVTDVQNSDSTTANDGNGFASTQAGFQVNLNPYIFPSPHDRSTDIVFTVVLRVTYEGFTDFGLSTGVLSGDDFGGSNDQSWCAGILANTYDGNTATFCAQYADAASGCPDTCVRRSLRRNLQQVTTPINGGDDFMQLTTTVTLNPTKAEINGHVDTDSESVRFTLLMTVDDSHIDLWENDRALYFHRMDYKLDHLTGAIDGQVRSQSITRVIRGDAHALRIVVDINSISGVTDAQYSPASIAQNLEMVIQTGQIYYDEFFLGTEVYSMEYEAIDDSPDKVHFGEVSPIDTSVDYQPDSASTLSCMVLLISFLFMW